MPPAPGCKAITQCLERALPWTYDASHRADVIQRALGCLGGSAQTAWKPLALMERLVTIAPTGGLVVDPFVGSTCIAAGQQALFSV
jgi:hypothetical protein